jgi:hypothetical protein
LITVRAFGERDIDEIRRLDLRPEIAVGGSNNRISEVAR